LLHQLALPRLGPQTFQHGKVEVGHSCRALDDAHQIRMHTFKAQE
jgi:hypothetical protein